MGKCGKGISHLPLDSRRRTHTQLSAYDGSRWSIKRHQTTLTIIFFLFFQFSFFFFCMYMERLALAFKCWIWLDMGHSYFRLPKIFINHSDWSHEFNQILDMRRRAHWTSAQWWWKVTQRARITGTEQHKPSIPSSMGATVCRQLAQSVAGKYTIYK